MKTPLRIGLVYMACIIVTGCANTAGLRTENFNSAMNGCSRNPSFVSCMQHSQAYASFDQYQKSFIGDMAILEANLRVGVITRNQYNQSVTMAAAYYNQRSIADGQNRNCRLAAALSGLGAMAGSNSYTLAGAAGEGLVAGSSASHSCD